MTKILYENKNKLDMKNKSPYLLDPSFVEASFYFFKNHQQQVKPFCDFKRSVEKACSGHYQYFLLPSFYLKHKNLNTYLNLLSKKKLTPTFQIPSYHFQKYKKILLSLTSPFFINFIFKDFSTFDFKSLELFKKNIFFTFVISKKYKNTSLKSKLPEWVFKKTEVYSPYKNHFLDSFLTPKQLYRFIIKNQGVKASSYNIFDKRIAKDLDLEPMTKIFYEHNIEPSSVYFSIIIPTYNYKNQILKTVSCLSKQDYPKKHFEIIVVDDGSYDATIFELKKWAKKHPDCNIKLIHYPRVLPRKQGDARFRAGLARNLGVKHSLGKLLCFLDADILTPPYYLKTIAQEHKKYDILQLQRYHLNSNFSLEDLTFDDNFLKSHSYVEDKKYWFRFYQQGFQNQKTPWKYICTYGLSLLKKDFIEAGRFGKVFLYYGFEDTDLGYRLYHNKKKFFLSSIKVYHQAIPEKQQEYRKNLLRRYKLLCKTATIFFYRHLDFRIYEELKVFIKPLRSFSYFFSFKKRF